MKIQVSAIIVIVLMGVTVVGTPLLFERGAYRDVSVDVAYRMIENRETGIVILDVRTPSEYSLGALAGAILIPVNELEGRISELEGYRDRPIIVYSGNGSSGRVAAQILADHGFRRVYNVVGGIIAWIERGYPIYTTYHYITVDVSGGETSVQIAPLLLHVYREWSYREFPETYQYNLSSQTSRCTANLPLNVTNTITEKTGNTTKVQLMYELEGVTLEIAVTSTQLWSYAEIGTTTNRTINFILFETTRGGEVGKLYSLNYIVNHKEYNLTITTILTPLDPETYNTSYTIVKYATTEKTELQTLELINFKQPTTLSQLYEILSRVAEEIGRVYEEHGNKTLVQNYYIMKEETKRLAKLVKEQLQQYDKIILNITAILLDDSLSCEICKYAVGLICFALGTQVAPYIACAILCAMMTVAWIICFPICLTIVSSVIKFIAAVGVAMACYYLGVGVVCELLGYCP